MDKEIMWNIVNSLIAGGISLGSAILAVGEINGKVICVSLITAGMVALLKFKDYWTSEENEYKNKIFTILGG